MSSTDVLFYVDIISNKQSIFFSQIRTPSFSRNWPCLVSTAQSPIILWRLWSHKPSHKHDSNKYQSTAFVICDHKSDETRSVTHENKADLVWLMFRMLINQHYPHRANQKQRSPTNAASDWRGAGSVDSLAFETSIKPDMLCFRASQIWSHLICGRRLQMLWTDIYWNRVCAKVYEIRVFKV